MGLPELARTIAAQGRGNDRMLVHMEPQELQGLQALAQKHGGSLTINPKTGLPEAGFLSSFLPMAIGAGLDVASGGAATPLTMGLIAGGTGLADYAMTGSLGKGLAAGLGAYGGAGLADGLMAAGAGAGAGIGSIPTDQLAGGAGMSGTAQIPSSAMNDLASSGALGSTTAGTDAASLGGTSNMAGAGSGAAGTSGYPGSQSGITVAPGTTPSTIGGANAIANATTQSGAANLDQLKSGFSNVTNSPSSMWDFTKGNWKYGLAAAAPAIQDLQQANQMPGIPQNGTIRPYSFTQTRNPNFGQPGEAYFNQAYTAGTPYNYTGALTGPGSFKGNVGYAAGGDVQQIDPQTQEMMNAAINSNMIQQQNAYNAANAPHGYAHGGLGSINPLQTLRRDMIPTMGHYADGGRLLSGPGDGVSDGIHALINGKQPARLASGEFVIPARIVSELGNGSTESGASRLYAMMDRVQNARKKSIGKDKFAEDTKADKHLPE